MTKQQDDDAVWLAMTQTPSIKGLLVTAFDVLDALVIGDYKDFIQHGVGGRGGGSKVGLAGTQRVQSALNRLIGKGLVVLVGKAPAPVFYSVKGQKIEPSAPEVGVYRLA